MEDIYRKALVVSGCLGFHPMSSTFNEEFITSCFSNAFYADIALQGHEEAENIFNTVDAHIALDILEELRLTNSELEESTIFGSIAGWRQATQWAALVGLIQNPWFAHIWVVQEVALAASVRVCYGKRMIP